jgi:hypothetical protein
VVSSTARPQFCRSRPPERGGITEVSPAPTLELDLVSKLCERPGCSEPGAVAYGMVTEDLLFWLAPIGDSPAPDPSVLCLRHADAVVVPRGWTLDDQREDQPRLFKPPTLSAISPIPKARAVATRSVQPEQLQIDGTGEIGRPQSGESESDHEPDDELDSADVLAAPWSPEFDAADDLDGLLEVTSPLLARAFRGTDRPRR